MEMSRLTRDGTAEPVSRDQILRHARGQGNTNFPVQLTTSRIGNLTRLIHTLLYVMTIHTYIYCEVLLRAENRLLGSSAWCFRIDQWYFYFWHYISERDIISRYFFKGFCRHRLRQYGNRQQFCIRRSNYVWICMCVLDFYSAEI